MRLLYLALALTIGAVAFEVTGNPDAALGLLAGSEFFMLLLVLRLRRLLLKLAKSVIRAHLAH